MAVKAKTTKGAGGATDLYLGLVRDHPLRPIRTDEELDRAIAMVDRLSDRASLAPEEDDYLDVLATLIESYEAERFPTPDVPPSDILRHLIEAKGVTQSKLAADTGVQGSTVSEILSGKREVSRNVMRAFAAYFQVDPAVFV